jgi:hypothetical protein
MTATDWLSSQADPVSEEYHRTVPKPKTAVSIQRESEVRRKWPRTSHIRPTEIPPKSEDATCWWKPVPKIATNGVSTTAGIGGYATYQTPSFGMSSLSHEGASVR